MEELKTEWHDSTKTISDALEFLDNYFYNEHSDDKTAGQAYKTLRLCATTIIGIGNRLADDGR